MEITTISQVWRYFRWLPKWLLRRFFTQEKLASAIRFDIRARHAGVRLNLANQCPGYEIWFEVTNNTPFELTQDRAEFELTFEGVTGTTSQFIRKITLSSGQHKSFVIKGDLTDYRAQQIADLHTQYESSITVNALYQCKVREFTFHRNLDGIKPDIINIASRTQQNNHTKAV